MDRNKKYLNTVRILKSNRPVLDDGEKFTDDIIREISASSETLSIQDRLLDLLFGWVNIYWLRDTMAVAAVLFAGFFIIQQLVLADRLDKLEKQSIRMENKLHNQEMLPGMNQRILIRTMSEHQSEDSITVSVHDLEELVDNYWDLLRKNEEPELDAGYNFTIENRIRKGLERRDRENEL